VPLLEQARAKLAPPSTLTSARATPPNDQAQPRISVRSPSAMLASGAGATMIDSGAIAQTGRRAGKPAAMSCSSAASL
jgi:hypothetical protein